MAILPFCSHRYRGGGLRAIRLLESPQSEQSNPLYGAHVLPEQRGHGGHLR